MKLEEKGKKICLSKVKDEVCVFTVAIRNQSFKEMSLILLLACDSACLLWGNGGSSPFKRR